MRRREEFFWGITVNEVLAYAFMVCSTVMVDSEVDGLCFVSRYPLTHPGFRTPWHAKFPDARHRCVPIFPGVPSLMTLLLLSFLSLPLAFSFSSSLPLFGIILIALALDLALGDPPNRYHPVAWMGTGISMARRWAPRQGRWRPFLYGAAIVCGGAGFVALAGIAVTSIMHALPAPCNWLAHAWGLKSTLALKGLMQAGRQVYTALGAGELAEARRLLSWHLVSRDTGQLSEAQVAAATVESIAENTSDGVIAPLFYYCLGGLPAALAYRFINTADAMLGYRDAEREWLGKVPARLDDVVNLVPARLTALFLMLAAALLRENAWQCWRVWRRDAHLTASPNAGHPMSAMAGALHVVLEKIGHYRLGAELSLPAACDISRAIRLIYGAVAVGVGILLALYLVGW